MLKIAKDTYDLSSSLVEFLDEENIQQNTAYQSHKTKFIDEKQHFFFKPVLPSAHGKRLIPNSWKYKRI